MAEPAGMHVLNEGAVESWLAGKANNRKLSGNIKVGYSAPYAVYVHENTQIYHPTGQAKFLSSALKDSREEMKRIAREIWVQRQDLELAMFWAGLKLLDEANRRVPVDTGFLRASGYVKK